MGATGDFGHGEPESLLVESVGLGGFGGDGHHLLLAQVEGLLALPVGAGDDPGLRASVPAGTGRGFQEGGEGHGGLFLSSLSFLNSLCVLGGGRTLSFLSGFSPPKTYGWSGSDVRSASRFSCSLIASLTASMHLVSIWPK